MRVSVCACGRCEGRAGAWFKGRKRTVERRDDMPEGWPPLRACENEIRARPARALNPATPSTRLRAGPSVRGADRYRERDVCAPHFPPFELQSRPRCSAVVRLFLTPSPFTLSPSSSLKLLSLPSSSVRFGRRRIVPRSSLRSGSLAVVCAPPLIVVPSLLSGAVLDGTAIPRTCQVPD